ncbi:MAG: TonB-dependent receptor plug domain-containing protein, partial [bacterium]
YAVDDHGDSIQWQQYLGQVKQPFLVPQGEDKNTTVSTKVYLNATASQLVDQNLALQFKASYFRNHFKNDFVDNQDVSTSERFRAEYQANVEPSIHHSLVFGIQGTYDIVDGSIFGERKAFISGSYIQDEIKFTDRFSISTGLRLDISQVIAGNTESEVSPKFGFLYDLNDMTKLRGSIGRGFRAPSIAELFTSTSASGFRVIPNPALRAESSWSAELGINTLIAGRFLVDVAVYQERYFDFINPSIGLNDKLQLEIQFNNVQDARIRGIESNIRSGWFGNKVQTIVTYIFVDPRDLDNDQLLTYRPQHLLTASGTLKLGLFEFGLDYRFASKLEQEQLEVFPEDPRLASKVFDARTGVSIGSTTVMLNVENLFNYHYNQIERNLEPTRKVSVSWQSDF